MSALTDSARDKPCMAMTEVCNGNPSTVVWCHLNDLALGHGVGIKVPDVFGFYGCSACHDLVDGRRGKLTKAEKRAIGYEACVRTWHYLLTHGLLSKLLRAIC